jgi:translocon-associated protein subunit alpha
VFPPGLNRASSLAAAAWGHQVVEPPTSFLDPSLLFLYALLGLIAFYGASLAYRAFVAPPSGRQSSAKKIEGSARRLKVVPAPTADKPYPASTTPYDEEWVPEHLLRQRKKAAGATSASSGDEVTSGGESVKKRKGGKGGGRK